MSNKTNNSWNAPRLTALGEIHIGTGSDSRPLAGTFLPGTNISWSFGIGTVQASVSGIITSELGGSGTSTPPLNNILIGSGSNPIQGVFLPASEILIGTGTVPSHSVLSGTGGINISVAPGTIQISSTATPITPRYSIPIVGAGGTSLTYVGPLSPGYILIGTGTASLPEVALPSNGTNISWVSSSGVLQANLNGVVPVPLGGFGTSNPPLYGIPYVSSSGSSFSFLGPILPGYLVMGTGTAPTQVPIVAGSGLKVTTSAGSVVIGSYLNPLRFFLPSAQLYSVFEQSSPAVYGLPTAGNFFQISFGSPLVTQNSSDYYSISGSGVITVGRYGQGYHLVKGVLSFTTNQLPNAYTRIQIYANNAATNFESARDQEFNTCHTLSAVGILYLVPGGTVSLAFISNQTGSLMIYSHSLSLTKIA